LIKPSKTLQATDLWRKMLTMLFETGHPWITFKDACNVRSPQQHVGVVHSSNLCTEITLNTSDTETAVCNLGSVNLVRHLKQGPKAKNLDHDKLKKTINTAMRMLDNVIDINYYAVKKPVTPTCVTVLWVWASWRSKTVCTSNAYSLRIPSCR
jgi:ribonucleoside-diphosphate reductase alpha chain